MAPCWRCGQMVTATSRTTHPCTFGPARKTRPTSPSPLVAEGLVYLCRENGNLICMDGETGNQLYEHRTHPDRHRASPVYADGKLYIAARDGTVTVVKAGKTYEELASNAMGEDISASPVVANHTLYLRTFEALYAIRSAE